MIVGDSNCLTIFVFDINKVLDIIHIRNEVQMNEPIKKVN